VSDAPSSPKLSAIFSDAFDSSSKKNLKLLSDILLVLIQFRSEGLKISIIQQLLGAEMRAELYQTRRMSLRSFRFFFEDESKAVRNIAEKLRRRRRIRHEKAPSPVCCFHTGFRFTANGGRIGTCKTARSFPEILGRIKLYRNAAKAEI